MWDLCLDGMGEHRPALEPAAPPDGGDEHFLYLGQGEVNQTRDNPTLGSSLASVLLVVLSHHGWESSWGVQCLMCFQRHCGKTKYTLVSV